MYSFQNYHRHSNYTNPVVPDSTVSPKDYAERAKELGHTILSSVEHAWQGRYVETVEIAKQYGLKPIIGAEAYFVKNRTESDKTNAHLILLAMNENGRRSLNRILSEANINGFYYRPRIDLPLVLSLPKNDVIVTTACVGGIWKYEDADELILQLSNHFGNNFYLEVQNHNTESQANLNRRIIELSNRYNIKTIFGVDSHYIYPEQAKDRDDYLLSKHIQYEDEVGWFMDYPDNETAYQRFVDQGVLTQAQIKEAMENTNVLLNVEEYKSRVFEKALKLPSIYPDKIQEEKDEIFTNLIWSKWETEKKNIPNNLWEKYEEEINKELDVVITTKMCDYFLLDYEVVETGKELGGMITMTGRGSAPSFYISKLLGFTTIDRINASVRLFPERFITKERILEAGIAPDIDFNLGNPEVFAQAQIEVLGENHSYPMVAYGTLKPKAAWKLYARAKNVDFETANKVSEQIEEYEMVLKHVDEDSKDNVDVMDYIESKYQQLFLESKKYLGIVSDYKIHPCAYVLYDGNIKEEIGLIKIKSGNNENIVAIIDGLWAEQYKFLKNDLLKVSVVELIYKVYERIGLKPHPLPELLKLCDNNEKVWEVYKNAWTMGINQVEQKSTSGRVAKYGPKNISELSAFVAAVRPGFKSNYKQFEAREPFSYGIPSLDSLIQTKEFPQSYLIYQESSMLVLAYAGIPISVTYEVVKNIAKKRVDKVLKYKEQFLKGMTEKIVQQENRSLEEAENVAHMTWQIIEDSSRYAFNSSHSYSVAGDSLYGAYLKSHYPLEFYETFLKILEKDGDKDRLADAKYEAQRAYKIKFPPLRFGQDNRQITGNKVTNEIMSSLTTIKGFNHKIGEELYELSLLWIDNFVDFLITAAEKGYLSKKYEDLIKINYFEKFGNNKKLHDFYTEFTSGKSRYNAKHKDKTKLQRVAELREYFVNLPDERFPFWQQINMENEILGNIQTTYPDIDKNYVYVMNINEKFSPVIYIYCLANGKTQTLKINKKVFENNYFRAGEIIFCKNFVKKPTVKFVNGKFEEVEGEFTWWLNRYTLVEPDEFEKIISNN